MSLDSLTIGELNELVRGRGCKENPFAIGKSYFIRTVTYHMVGCVEQKVGDILILKNASWVADSGRFSHAIKKGKLKEVEPVGVAFLNLNSMVDAFPWEHDLPDCEV